MINGARLLKRRNNAGPLTIQRAPQATQNTTYGGYNAEVTAPLVLDPCHIHTVTGRDLEALPEADRNKEIIGVYTVVRLYAADASQAADVIPYKGRNHRVLNVSDYDDHAGVYFSMAALEAPA